MTMSSSPSLKDRALAVLEYRQRHAKREMPDWFDTHAREKQLPPPVEGAWRFWLMLTGRGWGKTQVLIAWANKQAKEMPGSRGMIVAATAADARDILVEGESGLLNSGANIVYQPGKSQVLWPDYGTVALIRSGEKPDRLRGPQQHWAIADEVAAWKYDQEAWDMLMFGLRLGTQPRVAIATTPRPTKIIRGLIEDPLTHVTRGSTYENRDNLAPAFLDAIVKKYEGTRLGRQELDAEVLEDVPGALWNVDVLDATRVHAAPDLVRLVVSFDPPASSHEGSDEAGIVAAGIGENGHGYVIDDASMLGSVDGRLGAVIKAYHRHRADVVVVERNQGGDWIPHAIETKDSSVNVSTVWASRGKLTRAEPVAALYTQGKVHHVGIFSELEDQMMTWVPGEKSPDRMDALVWALTELLVEESNPTQVGIIKNSVDLFGSREKKADRYAGIGGPDLDRRRRQRA